MFRCRRQKRPMDMSAVLVDVLSARTTGIVPLAARIYNLLIKSAVASDAILIFAYMQYNNVDSVIDSGFH